MSYTGSLHWHYLLERILFMWKCLTCFRGKKLSSIRTIYCNCCCCWSEINKFLTEVWCRSLYVSVKIHHMNSLVGLTCKSDGPFISISRHIWRDGMVQWKPKFIPSFNVTIVEHFNLWSRVIANVLMFTVYFSARWEAPFVIITQSNESIYSKISLRCPILMKQCEKSRHR